jgi:hypothetical protein
MMVDLRENPLKEINGQRVIIGRRLSIFDSNKLIDTEMDLPKSNVLIYYTEDDLKFVPDQAERNRK